VRLLLNREEAAKQKAMQDRLFVLETIGPLFELSDSANVQSIAALYANGVQRARTTLNVAHIRDIKPTAEIRLTALRVIQVALQSSRDFMLSIEDRQAIEAMIATVGSLQSKSLEDSSEILSILNEYEGLIARITSIDRTRAFGTMIHITAGYLQQSEH
jgi:hypothetical protein